MLWRRLRRNKRGITLVEMVVAIAVTAILATALSTMMVPVINLYSSNSNRVELANAVTAKLNDIAMYMRSATGVYITTTPKSFPDMDEEGQYDAVCQYGAIYGIAMYNYYSRTMKDYLYPEFMGLSWDENTGELKDFYVPMCNLGFIISSDDYQSKSFYCESVNDFYFYVRPTSGNNKTSTTLEFHLKVKKGSTVYEGTKTISCDNLIATGDVIRKAGFKWNNKTSQYDKPDVVVPTTGTKEKDRYYSVWFSVFS